MGFCVSHANFEIRILRLAFTLNGDQARVENIVELVSDLIDVLLGKEHSSNTFNIVESLLRHLHVIA